LSSTMLSLDSRSMAVWKQDSVRLQEVRVVQESMSRDGLRLCARGRCSRKSLALTAHN
jgi:hypothetical protein